MDDAQLITLDQLAKILGKPDPTLLDALLDGEPRDELIRLGARIKSDRIITDGSRMYALAYTVWAKATPEQKQSLVGFSADLLALAVDRALALRELTAAADATGQSHGAKSEARAAAAQRAFSDGIALRDHAYTALRTVTGRDAALRARLDADLGTAENATGLENGLRRLALFGRELLETKKKPVATRVKLARLDGGYLDRLEAAANAVRDTARSASARSGAARASQGEIDLLDGINLYLLGAILHAFEAAHDIDATIPKLVPIATRRLLGKRTHASAPRPAPSPAPTN